MKMKALSLAVAGAVGSFAFPAQASQMDYGMPGTVLIVPYYTVQNGNSTLINLVNTDTTTGKVIKVRFRGAVDSDDVFDFQVFLSPGDMWTADVSMAASGKAKLTTFDNSCTLPANVNQEFVTDRLSGTDAEKAAGTREGYVEIITMADIPATYDDPASTAVEQVANPLYTAIKHVNGVAPCTPSALTSLVNDQNAWSEWSSLPVTDGNKGKMTPPSLGIMGNWTIINVPGAAAWTEKAVAIPMWGERVLYWRQTAQSLPYSGPGGIYENTADGVLLSGAVTAANYDLPDLSTPFNTIGTGTGGSMEDPRSHISMLAAYLFEYGIVNEYMTGGVASLETDWVITQPTRRYMVAGRPFDGNDAGTGKTSTSVDVNGNEGSGWVDEIIWGPYEGRMIGNCVATDGASYWDRSEQSPGVDIVISPGNPVTPVLCGEVAVLTFNNNGSSTSGVLGAQLTVADITLPYAEGWAALYLGNFDALDEWQVGLPVIAHAYVSAYNPLVSPGTAGNYGGVWRHRSDSIFGIYFPFIFGFL